MVSKQKHDLGRQKYAKNEGLNPLRLTHRERQVKRKMSRNMKLSDEEKLIARERGWGHEAG